MRYLLVLITLTMSGCDMRPSPVNMTLPRDADTQNIIATLSNQNLSLKDKEKKYRAMITAGQIGLANVMQEIREEEIAQARRIALWVSLASILGFVAGCVLLYLGSKVFGMISIIASGALLIGCIAYAEFIQYAGPMLGGLLASVIGGFILYEAWKNRAALHVLADAVPVKNNVPAPVARLIQRVQKKADILRGKATLAIDETAQKVG